MDGDQQPWNTRLDRPARHNAIGGSVRPFSLHQLTAPPGSDPCCHLRAFNQGEARAVCLLAGREARICALTGRWAQRGGRPRFSTGSHHPEVPCKGRHRWGLPSETWAGVERDLGSWKERSRRGAAAGGGRQQHTIEIADRHPTRVLFITLSIHMHAVLTTCTYTLKNRDGRVEGRMASFAATAAG